MDTEEYFCTIAEVQNVMMLGIFFKRYIYLQLRFDWQTREGTGYKIPNLRFHAIIVTVKYTIANIKSFEMSTLKGDLHVFLRRR